MPRELSGIERTTLADICEIIRETIDTERIYLFGSRAYGILNEDSDYDILVCRASQFAQRQVVPSLERKIARDGVLLYDKDSDAKSASL